MKHKRQVIFIRTQCDTAIRGLRDQYEDETGTTLTRDQAFDRLKENSEAYMQKDVLDASGKKFGKIGEHFRGLI